jgi:hypothetical protein
MKRQLVEGRATSSHILKEYGKKEEKLEDTNVGDGKFAKQEDVTGYDSVYVSTGKTVELAPYEFARIDIGINVHYSKDKVASEIEDALNKIVSEIANKEEAHVLGRDSGFSIPLSALDIVNRQCVGRYISIAYGLTLKGKKRYEINKLDNARKYQIDDGVSVLVAYDEIRDELGFKLDQRRKDLQG